MLEHLSKKRVAKYKNGALPLTELLATKQHLSECSACHDLVDKTTMVESMHNRLFSSLRTLPDNDSHLSYEQIANFVDRDLSANEREIAEAHLESCPDCRFEAISLQESQTESMEKPTSSLWYKLKGFVTSSRFLFPMQAVLSSAVVLLLLYAVVLQGRIHTLNTQLQEVAQSNQALQDQIASLTANPTSDPQGRAITPTNNLIATLSDNGHEISLDSQGNLSGFQKLTEGQERLLKNALGSGRVKARGLVSDHNQGLEVRSGNSQPISQSLSPVGTVVPTTRPTFQWKPVAGATWFKVTIYNASANVVAESPELKESRWTPATDLRRGEIYSWEVTSQINSKEVLTPPRKFKVLGADCVGELQRAKARAGSSHLLLGLLYADCGLIEEAEKELSALVRANPQSPKARNLLSSVRRLRSR